MCGIYGYFDQAGKAISTATLDAMARSIRHRGPDDHGRHEASSAAIGNCRLSIIDLESGHQPFLSDDGKIALVQNGEIYNYIELAQELRAQGVHLRTTSDTEVLLKLYEIEGPAFLHRLNGMFAIAVLNAKDGSLWLARDRIGVKPLYVWQDGSRLVFASEIKALLLAGAPRELDPVALHHMLTFNYVPPPLTAFRGIRHLLPGHTLHFSREGLRESCWWSLAAQQAEHRTEEAWIDEFRDLLKDSVRIRMRADVPYGAFLSGGLDSSSVVAEMAALSAEPVRTFCIGFQDPRFDESPFAAEVAAKFATQHTMQRVEADLVGTWARAVYHCDQPHGDASFMPMLWLSELAVKHVKTVLTGDGGDEMFGGYTKYAEFFRSHPIQGDEQDAFRRAYHHHISVLDEGQKRRLYTQSFADRVQGVDSFSISEQHFQRAEPMDHLNQALYLDAMLLLPGNNLVKPDRMPMAVSLEARDPFLDPRLMEFAFKMPGELKVKEGQTRYLYKKAVEPVLGRELTHRRKQMFTVPIGEWFKNELRGFTEQILLGPRTAARGIFDPVAVKNLIESHASGQANFTRELRALIVAELWHRIFIDSALDHLPTPAELGIASPSISHA